MGSLTGRVAIVTGAARGLGRDYALYLARDGASVVLADTADMERVTSAVVEAGAQAIAIPTDVTDRTSLFEMAARAEKHFGQIDILISNAGLWRGLEEPGLLQCPEDVWHRAWAVNVNGTLFAYQAVMPAMCRQGRGRIVNISSMTADVSVNAYGLTKAAVERLTIGMAREAGQMGITVNCIAPGICVFEGARGQLPQFQRLVDRNAIPRAGTSHDLYGAIKYLCSDEAAWVTGQLLHVDGGALTR